MISMELSRIIISENSEEQMIVLKEVNGARAFPIVIGIWEIAAIDRNIKQKKAPRPMTHDLIENILHENGIILEKVIVNDLKDRTFYARLVLRQNGRHVEVDSRPSDAICLAVQMKAPIFVEERVLEALTKEAESFPPPEEWKPPESTEEEKDEGEPA